MGNVKAKKFGKQKDRRENIARERIALLLEQAETVAHSGDLELASRYAGLARRIGMRYQVGMPRGFNIKYCKRCETYLMPGSNSQIRITAGRLTRQCQNCQSRYRIPLVPRRE